MNIIDDLGMNGGDDKDKLFPESNRSSDEQTFWLALGVLLLLGAMLFGLSQCAGNAATTLTDSFRIGDDKVDADLVISGALEDERDLSTSADFFGDGDFDGDFGNDSAGPYTVLAPTNNAWDDSGIDLESISTSAAATAAGHHVIQGEYTLDELIEAGTVKTVGGHELTFSDDLVNGLVEVEDADIQTENGIVHKISSLLPARQPEPEPTVAPEPTPTAEPEPTPLPEPTAVPEPTPAPEPTPVPEPEPEPAPPAAFTLADLAGETPDLTRLTGIVGALGLDATLADADAGPFTIFAPNDNAVTEASGVLGTFEASDLQSTVNYHIVPRLVPASEVQPGARFETLGGQTLVVSSDGGLPGGINIVTTDLEADNGLVHVIDGVLVPTDITLRNLTQAIADLEGIRFDVGSASIRPESEMFLVDAAIVLRMLPEGTEIEVGGHTDSDGGADGNQALSEARATSVVAYLVAEGVPQDSLTAVGYGESQLLRDPETSDADKQVNRRIEFTSPGQ